MNRILLATVVIALWGGSCAAHAEGDLTREGSYYSFMGHYLKALDSGQIDNGFGGSVGGGWSFGTWTVEANALYSDLKTSSRGEGADFVPKASTSYIGGSVDFLIFPFRSVPGLFGLVGAGGLQISKYPTRKSSDFGTVSTEAGLGYLFDLGRFSIRSQAVFRRAERFTQIQRLQPGNGYTDIDAPHSFKDLILGVGLHVPLSRPAPPPPPPAPVEVVAPVTPPDADGDGVADSLDHCPGTPVGTKVGQDGCPLPPPCKSPEPGERISLGGCGTGETIVLRGVTFAFDSAELEPNARVILDNVADELKAYPEIKVELSGHTDSRGSDEYNRVLSDRRAAAVLAYLSEAGIDPLRMTSVGRGESQPVADNETEDGRALNRRTELTVTSGAASQGAATAPDAVAPVDAAMAPADAEAPVAVTPAATEPAVMPAETDTPVEPQ